LKKFTKVMSIILALAMMLSTLTFVTSAETDVLADSGVIDFENGGVPTSGIIYPANTNFSTIENIGGRGKVLKISQPSNTHQIWMDASSMQSASQKPGRLTYDFDVCMENDALAIKSDTDSFLLMRVASSYITSATSTAHLADFGAASWNNVKLVIDFSENTVKYYLNGNFAGQCSTSAISGFDKARTFKIQFRMPKTCTGLYFDNVRVTYTVETPEIDKTGNGITHSWLEGIKLPFNIELDKTSVETAGNIKLLKSGSPDDVVSATVELDSDNKTVIINPTEPIDPNGNYKVLITANVKGKNGVSVKTAIEKPIVFEALGDVEVDDGDISLFDKNGTELISKVKIIKARFNVPMDKASVEADGNITLELVGDTVNTPVALTAEYDMNDGYAVTLNLGEELKSDSTYLLTFGTNIKRIDGTAITEPIVKTITTPVLEKPVIITDNITYVDKRGETGRMDSMKKKIKEIRVPFSISLDSSTVNTGNISLVKLTDGGESPVTLNTPTLEDDKTVVIVPTTPLDAQSEYTLTFNDGVKAVNGETIESGENVFIFETAVLDTPKVTAVTASADGSIFAEDAGVADITTVKAEFNYDLNPVAVSADTVKLEKYVSGSWTDAGATFAFDGSKSVTWTVASGLTFPEGVKFRISFLDTVEDIYGDKLETGYEVTFVTKQSAAANGLTGSILGKTLTYSGKLLSGSEAVANEKMSVLVYKQGGSPVPFGADTKHFDIITTGEDGSFGGSILLYDNESTPRIEELWLAFDAQSMGMSNQRDARVVVQFTNTLMDEASVADLKRSSKSVFTYITEAADSDDMKAIVPSSGLTAIQNKKVYEGLGVWVSKYTAMTDEEKAAVNAALQNYKTQLTTENISKILNASLIAADFASLGTDAAVADLITYNDNIEAICVEELNFSTLSTDSQNWVAQNVKANNPSGFANYEVFIKEVRKAMLLDMVSSTTYTELADLFINNKALVNDGLSENKLAELEAETSLDIIDAAMRSIKLSNDESKFRTTTALAEAIKSAVKNAKKPGSQGGGAGSTGGGSGSAGGGSGSVGNDNFSIGTDLPSTSQNNGNGLSGNGSAVFKDLSEHNWAEAAILNLYNKGIVSGVGNGSFEPNRGVTREEFLKMVCEALEFDTSNSSVEFEDVTSDEWYAKYIASAVEAGIVNGVSDTHFGTGSLISREDMAVMIFRALAASRRNIPANKKGFNDSEEISDYALEAVETLNSMGIIRGVGDGTFAPKNTATRAEAAVIISRCLQ